MTTMYSSYEFRLFTEGLPCIAQWLIHRTEAISEHLKNIRQRRIPCRIKLLKQEGIKA